VRVRVRVRVHSFAVQQRREMETIQAKVRIFHMHTHIRVFCALARELLSANKHAHTRVCDVNRQGCMGRNSARIYTFGCWCGDARTCRERRVHTRISCLANRDKPFFACESACSVV
jgi:hypothetical protein